MKNVTISIITRQKTGLLHQKDPSVRLCFIFDLIVCPLTATFINGSNGQSEAATGRGWVSYVFSAQGLTWSQYFSPNGPIGWGQMGGWMDGWIFIQLEWVNECASSERKWGIYFFDEQMRTNRQETRFILDYWQLPIFFTLLSPSSLPPSPIPYSLTAASYKGEGNCMAYREWWQIDCAVLMPRVMEGWQIIGLD